MLLSDGEKDVFPKYLSSGNSYCLYRMFTINNEVSAAQTGASLYLHLQVMERRGEGGSVEWEEGRMDKREQGR